MLAVASNVVASGPVTNAPSQGVRRCPAFPLEGFDPISGTDNGCTLCTSDSKHGDAKCGTPVDSGGTMCKLMSKSGTQTIRKPKTVGGVCIGCEASTADYTYQVLDLGGPC